MGRVTFNKPSFVALEIVIFLLGRQTDCSEGGLKPYMHHLRYIPSLGNTTSPAVEYAFPASFIATHL